MQNQRLGRKGSFAIKLDMNKAYECMEWRFIGVILLKTGFSFSWVDKIIWFTSTVSYSVVMNGLVGEKFVPSQGLR